MNQNCQKFYDQKCSQITKLRNEKKIQLFLTEVKNIYPNMLKLFENDTSFLIKKQDCFNRFEMIKQQVLTNTIPKIERFNVGLTDLVVTVNKKHLTYQLNNPLTFMKVCLNIDVESPYYYLMLSYLMIPCNYDVIQLFDKVY
jgi:hypothetical protein